MTYLLDTDTCIAILRSEKKVVTKIQSVAPSEIAFSSVTRYELHFGALRCAANRRKEELMKIKTFLNQINELPFKKATAEHTAQIRQELAILGLPIGPIDLQIAATALESNLILVTGNDREFTRIENPQIENWIR